MLSSKKTNRLVMTALFSAIIIVMTVVPYVGYITYGAISITTIHIPVIIGAIFLGPVGGSCLGFVWGITSLVKALFTGPIEAGLFMNPLISVLPRILVGFIIGGVSYLLLKKWGKKPIAVNVIYIISALIGTLSNTVLVISAISLFGNTGIIPLGTTLKEIFGALVAINSAIEIPVALILTPVILTALNRNLKMKR